MSTTQKNRKTNDDSWPALKVRRATDLLRVSRVEMHNRNPRASRTPKIQSHSQIGNESSDDTVKITIPEAEIVPAVNDDKQQSNPDGAVNVIELLNIDGDDDVITSRDDDIEQPLSATGTAMKLELLDRKLCEHDYKLFQRTSSPTKTRTRISSAAISRSAVFSHEKNRSRVQTRPMSAQVRSTASDDTAPGVPKKLGSRSAVHLNVLAHRAGKSVKFMKRLIDREPPDAIRIDTQVIDYSIETDGLRECRDLQLRLLKSGVNVSLETLKKGLLPPTQYGFERRQVKTLTDDKIFNFSDGLFSHPSTWMPAQPKARRTQLQQEKQSKQLNT